MHSLTQNTRRDEMTARERVLTTLKFGRTDRVPCMPYIRDMAIKNAGYRFSEILEDIDKYVHSQTKALQDFHTDAVWDWGIAQFFSELTGGKVLFFEDDQPASEPPEPVKLAQTLKRLELNKSPNLLRDLEVVRKLKQAVGPDYPVVGYSVMPFRFAAEARGMQQIMLDLILEPDTVRELQEAYLPLGVKFAEELANAGADIIWLTNPLANSSCISRNHFAELVHPYCTRFFQELNKRGIKTIYHICGDWSDRLDLVVEEGASCLYIDKGDLAETKRTTGKKATLMGNVDVIGALLEGTSEKVALETRHCLESGSPGGGFILSGSCGVPRDVPAANLLAMTETCLKFDQNKPS